MKRRAPSLERGIPLVTLVLAVVLSFWVGRSGTEDSLARADAQSAGRAESAAGRDPNTPQPFRARGRLVCLAEEMKDRYGAEVQPVHDHVVGFRLDATPIPEESRPAEPPTS